MAEPLWLGLMYYRRKVIGFDAVGTLPKQVQPGMVGKVLSGFHLVSL